MIDAAIVGASLGSAMKYAVPTLEELGYDSRDFMRQVMQQLSGQGVPGAQGLFDVQFSQTVGPAPSFAAVQNSGRDGVSLA